MRKSPLIRFGVALSFALVAGVLTHLIFDRRDLLFAWDWAHPRGEFREQVDPKLVVAARDLAESRAQGQACVVRALGRDDSFLFAAVGCATFAEAEGKIKKLAGDEAPVPTRMRVSGDSLRSFEQPDSRARENSVHRLFPSAAFEKIRYGVPAQEYLNEGWARMRERSLVK